ncbi:MAG: energy transducer TonB [Alphaproteobacteria bacterium]
MSYADYRISTGSAPRRLIGLCVGIFVPLATIFALNQGLKLNIVQKITELAVVAVHSAPESQPMPTPPPPNPTFDSEAIDMPAPDIEVNASASGPTVTASVQTDVLARFRTSNSLPLYPEIAERNCEQGTVALNLRIGADGRVADASVATSSGYPALDDAALKAAHGWQFTPARQNGSAVESTITQIVKFDLRNEIGVSMTAAEVRECLKS